MKYMTYAEQAAQRRRDYYAKLRAERRLTVAELIAARPDLHPLQAVAADLRPIREWVAERERAEAAAPLPQSSASDSAPAGG